MRSFTIAFLITVAPLTVGAQPSRKDVAYTLTNSASGDSKTVQFGFDSRGVNASPKNWDAADRDRKDLVELLKPTFAASKDKTAAWVVTVARRADQCAGLAGTIDKCKDFEDPRVNVLVLYDHDATAKAWNPVAVHSAIPLDTKAQAKAALSGHALEAIPNHIDPSAAPAVELFKSSLVDPKLLATSVSKGNSVVLFGSGPNEKVVGGQKVASTLVRWKLAFTVRDGIAAGTTSSKTVAWVAANVDARPVGKPQASAIPYRVLCIYEKTNAWKLVAITFSYPTQS